MSRSSRIPSGCASGPRGTSAGSPWPTAPPGADPARPAGPRLLSEFTAGAGSMASAARPPGAGPAPDAGPGGPTALGTAGRSDRRGGSAPFRPRGGSLRANAPMTQPDKTGMPSWLPRAMMLAVWTVIGFAVAGWLFFQLRGLLVLLLISLFLALALEPAVNWLHRHSWPRGLATGAVMLAALGVLAVFVSVLGSMLVGQVLEFAAQIPAMSRALLSWVNTTFNADFQPEILLAELTDVSGQFNQWASSAAENAWGAGTALLLLLFNGLTVALFTFYLTADGPRFRRTICSVLPPRTQSEVLRAWEIAIDKTGGYIYSRALLALISTAAHFAALVVLDVDYAFALALDRKSTRLNSSHV